MAATRVGFCSIHSWTLAWSQLILAAPVARRSIARTDLRCSGQREAVLTSELGLRQPEAEIRGHLRANVGKIDPSHGTHTLGASQLEQIADRLIPSRTEDNVEQGAVQLYLGLLRRRKTSHCD